MIRIFQRLPFPPSSNRYWRSARGRVFLSAEAKAYRAMICSLVSPDALVGPLILTAVFYPPDKRRWDLDNRIKQFLDALQHAGVYQDDGQIVRIVAQKGEPSPGGYCAAMVETVEHWDNEIKGLTDTAGYDTITAEQQKKEGAYR